MTIIYTSDIYISDDSRSMAIACMLSIALIDLTHKDCIHTESA